MANVETKTIELEIPVCLEEQIRELVKRAIDAYDSDDIDISDKQKLREICHTGGEADDAPELVAIKFPKYLRVVLEDLAQIAKNAGNISEAEAISLISQTTERFRGLKIRHTPKELKLKTLNEVAGSVTNFYISDDDLDKFKK